MRAVEPFFSPFSLSQVTIFGSAGGGGDFDECRFWPAGSIVTARWCGIHVFFFSSLIDTIYPVG